MARAPKCPLAVSWCSLC